MTDSERLKLRYGPYSAPGVRVGDLIVCLYCDGDVVVTGLHDCPIGLWPRGRPKGRRGRSGLVVTADLARAVCMESAPTIAYWWQTSTSMVRCWKRSLNVEPFTPGALSVESAAATHAQLTGLTSAPSVPWTPEQIAMLGTVPDEQLVDVICRTREAIQQHRAMLDIPAFDPAPLPWTSEEDAIVVLHPGQLALTLLPGRSLSAIHMRRFRLRRLLFPSLK